MRKAVNRGFFEYVEARRMEAATALLKDSDIPSGQIYKKSGYASATTFYRAFKRCFGISTTAYRERYHQAAER